MFEQAMISQCCYICHMPCSKLSLEALPGYRPTFLCCEGLPFVVCGENWLMQSLDSWLALKNKYSWSGHTHWSKEMANSSRDA